MTLINPQIALFVAAVIGVLAWREFVKKSAKSNVAVAQVLSAPAPDDRDSASLVAELSRRLDVEDAEAAERKRTEQLLAALRAARKADVPKA